jgi:LmbE family N-acetylglucosaminyl deacetylase
MLAIGAHPDDVEIGAAALISKMHELGHEVHILVLTDDPVNGTTRRAEASNGAAEMGVAPERVHFLGVEEGYLRADIDAVRSVRQLVQQHGIQPDIVVTHTRADSHNDHVEANGIAHAAFRNCVFLHYSTHISAEVSHFSPTVFVDVNPDRQLVKDRALKSYHSQASRIGRHDLTGYAEKLGRRAGLDRAEGFEVCVQYGARDVVRKTAGLSDSPFHRFWLPVVREHTVTLLYESSAGGDSPQTYTHRNAGRDKLRQAFVDRWSPYPLRELCSDSAEALGAAKRGSVVTIGGPRTNPAAREHQNLVWTVGPSYLEKAGSRLPAGGYVARSANPFVDGAHVVSVAGATDVATRAGVEFLADPGRSPDLARVFDKHRYVQVVYVADGGELRIIDVQPTTGRYLL